ncbi:hypothetical protein TWF696_009322 [Orbilia brochopaga]|uniref:[histone H3]-trimethyl-L-lysine(9) demethylase n=1 Tax=Orbilia brochopaga TaxID=3140254 RepID=A0AAV9UJB7_9PEZI
MSTSAEAAVAAVICDDNNDANSDNQTTVQMPALEPAEAPSQQPVPGSSGPSAAAAPPADPVTQVQEEEEDEDIGEIFPDHYYDNGKVPVFKPTMDQFRSFKKFVAKIDHYGMKSGIIKIIPPKEWRDSLPPLDEKVRDIKIKNPIVQHIGGTTGVYRQTNLQKQKTYNLPQWRQVCESSEHQPPAKRGERRKNQDTRSKPRPRPSRPSRQSMTAPPTEEEGQVQRPLTPPPGDEAPAADTPVKEEEGAERATPTPTPKKGRQPAARPKRVYVRKTKEELAEAAAEAEEIWNGFNYRIQNADEFTPERCEELERHYWRTLTYNNPLYGADMPGSLFDDTTTSWNVAHLENILDCLGTKLPGVNTAYLYLGMWKATFSWHLEDVDLYSINYIHFGAPKQWYSISQEDAPRFHAAMKNIWPTEAKKCDQFLRHKTFLASPSYLETHYNIKVNKLVHHEGEFVITFPFGYHAGFNLGYNCAESVNFATEAWLEYGRNAKKCECIDDAVWVDAHEIERKLHGIPTEDELELEEEEEEEDSDDEPTDLPTPPESIGEGEDGAKKPKRSKSTKKRKSEGDASRTVKKLKIKFSKPAAPVCALCPHNPKHEGLLNTEEGKKAHKLCAMYIPETFFTTDPETNEEKVSNVAGVPTARTNLKCYFCRLKQGACFQCSETKCVRAYHATCAAAAGVLVQNVVVEELKDDNGNTTQRTELDFRCRFHRPKRTKEHTPETLEQDTTISDFARKVQPGDIIQFQLYLGDIFAGIVLENRITEQMLLVEVLPSGLVFEVEWKYSLCSSIMKTAPVAKPTKNRSSLPAVRTDAKGKRVAVEPKKTDFYADIPNTGDQFLPETTRYSWAEFHRHPVERNPFQEPAIKIWYYVGEHSTENIPAWTKDPNVRVADKDAVEPHLQRRSSNSESGPCYMTQAEQAARMQAMAAAQQRQAAYYQQQQALQQAQQQQAQQQAQQQQQQSPVATGNTRQIPQVFHTQNWRQPATPQAAGPIASTSNGQRFVVASANGGRRVFYSPLQPTNYQSFQGTPHRVSYTSATMNRVQATGTVAARPAASVNTGPPSVPAAAAAPAKQPGATLTSPPPAVPSGSGVAPAPPNVTVPPAPLSSATPS